MNSYSLFWLTIVQCTSGRLVVNTITATKMITRAKQEKNATDADGHGQDRVIGTEGQDRVTNVRDRVTETAVAIDEKTSAKDISHTSDFVCSFSFFWRF